MALGQIHAQAAGQDYLVVHQPVECLRRRLAGHAVVYRRRQAIDVRPRALALVLILLDRRVTVLERDGHGLSALGRFARAAEVQQSDAAALEHQVVGAYVPVYQPRLVHRAQRRKQRLYHVQQLARRYAAAALGDKLLEGRAVHVLHDDIGRVVQLEEIAHADYLRLLIHARHRPGLVEEAAFALLIAARRSRIAADRQRDLRMPCDPVRREIFLYCDLKLQPKVTAYVGYAEAALAKHAAYEIAVHQHRPRRDMVRQRRVASRCEPAARAAAVF